MWGWASIQWAIVKLLSEISEDWRIRFIDENTESALQWSYNGDREEVIGMQAMVWLYKEGIGSTGANSQEW